MQIKSPWATAVSGSAAMRTGRPVCSLMKRSIRRSSDSAAAEHQAVVDQIGGQIGTAMVQRQLDRLDDLLQGLGQGLPHLLAGDRRAARQAAYRVDAA